MISRQRSSLKNITARRNGTHPGITWFFAEKQQHPGGSLWAEPGKGVYNDLWLMTADGSAFWRLTDLPADPDYGVLHPHFSRDGKNLAWAQMYEGTRLNDPKKTIGSWMIKTADFTITPQGPEITNIQTHEPGGPGFYENYGFSPDGSQLLFSSNFEATNLLEVALQGNYLFDLNSGEITKLTVKGYNEQANFTPDGSKVFWMSSRDNQNNGTDYWMANPDGTDHERVTFLNHPTISNHLPKEVQYLCTDFSFHPDGKKLVSFLQTDPGPPVDGIIVIMELK